MSCYDGHRVHETLVRRRHLVAQRRHCGEPQPTLTDSVSVLSGLLCSSPSSACLNCPKTTASRTTSTSSTSRRRRDTRRRSRSWPSPARRNTTPSETPWGIQRSIWPSRCTNSPPPAQDGYVHLTLAPVLAPAPVLGPALPVC